MYDIGTTTGDGKIVAQLEWGDALKNEIALRLVLGPWWGNPSAEGLLKRYPNPAGIEDVIKAKAVRLLKPILDRGLAASIEVDTARPARDRIEITVEAVRPDGGEVSFTHYVGVI